MNTMGLDLTNLDSNEKEVLEKVESIGGHLLASEIVVLFRLAKTLQNGSKILEIGSYRGRSTNALGHAICGSDTELYCLDIWQDYESQTTGPRQTDSTASNLSSTDFAVFEDFLRNTEWLDNVRALRGSTR
ncbi:hypothetical protein D1AOALGA4SA_1982 [Olavius algarvensis Delta 1 endosymbiont]|nr:hypothetical protein D1AOALGA4SA_1982 [Olavius algarvensis Delta 1 endosymbiont]